LEFKKKYILFSTKEKMNNREKKTSPKLGKFWCISCDRAFIGKGQKCHIKTNQNRDYWYAYCQYIKEENYE